MANRIAVGASAAKGVFALAIGMFLLGCDPANFWPVLDVPLVPTEGVFRSPLFSIHSTAGFVMGIGIEPMRVDEVTCRRRVAELQIVGIETCNSLTPPVGAFTWSLYSSGKLVASGSAPERPSDIPAKNVHSMLKEDISWGFSVGFQANAGDNYTVELKLLPSPVPLASYHPRLAIVKSFK